MFFEVSPVRTCTEKKAKPVVLEKQDIDVLILAPFTPNPKIFFENVAVGKSSTQKLLIRNPTNNDIDLFISKLLPEELSVEFSWKTTHIHKYDEVLLELKWLPQCSGSWRHIFTIEDGYKLKRDIPVVLKSFSSNKKLKKCPAKKQTKPTFLVKKTKSPVSKHMRSPNRRPPLPNISNIPKIIIESPLSSTFGKENNPHAFIFNQINSTENDIRRETYILKPHTMNPPSNSKEEKFDDSLEKNDVVGVHRSNLMDLKLQSLSFQFTPTNTPQNLMKLQFKPEYCSTDEKSLENNSASNVHGRRIALFNGENITFEVAANKSNNISTETYVKGNTSTETYVKGNLSTETYLKDLSTEACPKGNISSSTYVKDSPSVADFASLQISPVFLKPPDIHNGDESNAKSVIEANLWAVDSNRKRPLVAIKEESSFSDSSNNSSRLLKRKSETTYQITPSKRPNLKEWAKVGGVSALRIAKRTSGLNLKVQTNKTIQVTTKDTSEVLFKDPFLLAATNKLDPFMTCTLYYNEEWIEEQAEGFKKWLNALVTPHEDLDSNEQSHPIDVARLWRECKKRNVAAAPTKEFISEKVNVNSRLNTLRRSAFKLYRSQDMVGVLSKVCQAIDGDRLTIRKDRDVHLDLGLQAEIMSILLSYNPLWLRIGLETIYNEKLPLHSNSDLMGISAFLSERFFKSPFLLRKYKSVHTPKYCVELKRYFLKKFLSLVYFLDRAKEKKLIPHDPCLFCKNAPVKESRDALLRLTREALSAVGDITKYLKLFGYIVTHKQTYINEFDYAVNCLGVDLRDGVRLTRVMEIMLLRNDLTDKLRVPAISRLQKVHNLKIVFQSLKEAGFDICEEISPKDIADGHKEKTLSFLWQIIHKFQAPYLVKYATVIQKWWRSDAIIKKREEFREKREKMDCAASKIQIWFRKQLLLRKIENWIQIAKVMIERIKQDRAAVKIQTWYRMNLERTKYLKVKNAILRIQTFARRWLVSERCERRTRSAIKIQSYFRMSIAKKNYQRLKYSVLAIENRYLALKAMKMSKNRYDSLKASTILIQRWIRATYEMRQKSSQFQQLRSSVIKIQLRFRALIAMKEQKRNFETMKVSVLIIEEWYLASKIMQIERKQFIVLKYSAITIQRQFRAKLLMKIERSKFISLKCAVICIQNQYRALLAMRFEVEKFQSLKAASIMVQRRFRAKMMGKSVRDDYLKLKNATLIIQKVYRAKLLGRIERKKYEDLKSATIIIQKRFRAQLMMILERHQFEKKKSAIVKIQNWFRAILKMREDFNSFQKLKLATLILQNRYRAQISMKKEAIKYQHYRETVILIQRRYRAQKLMKAQLKIYNQMKSSSTLIQRLWRAKKARDIERTRFLNLKKATIFIQNTFRRTKLSKEERTKFILLKMCVINIQQRFRAKLKMREEVGKYQKIVNSSILIQRKYRAYKLMQETRKIYNEQKVATIKIQNWYRSTKFMKIERKNYEDLRSAALTIQRHFKAQLAMKESRNEFLMKKNSAIVIQKWYRSLLLMRIEKQNFQMLKNCAIILQRHYRANIKMKTQIRIFNRLKSSVLLIQRLWRAKKARDFERNRYLTLKKAAIFVQTTFRNKKQSKEARTKFVHLKMCVVKIQQRFRAKIQMREDVGKYQKIVSSIILIQEKYRTYRLMKETRKIYIEQKLSAVKIQSWYRSVKVMQIQKKSYEDLRFSVVLIQRKFRANILMKSERKSYLELRKSTILIQERFRSLLEMKFERGNYLSLKNAVITLQQRYRANNSMKIQRNNYQHLRSVTIVIQRRYRAKVLMESQLQVYNKLKSSVLIIQRRWRANKVRDFERNRFLTLKKATVFIQSHFRNMQKTNEERSYFLLLKMCVSKMQQRFRAKLLMRQQITKYRKIVSSVILIQQKYRAYKLMTATRRAYNDKKEAAVVIQKWYRRLQLFKEDRTNFLIIREVVIKIQRRYRATRLAILSRNEYLKKKSAAIVIQRYFRGFLKMKTERKVYRLKVVAIFQIQRYCRGFLIRKKYANFLCEEARKERRVKKILSRAAAKIQAAWKGYRSRSVEKPQLTDIRRKLNEATVNAEPQKTLSYRCIQAVQLLASDNHTIVEIIDALEDIEFVTRRCKSTCFEMSRLLVEQLYLTIISSSRSLPEMNASTKAAEILINFCKYPPSKANSWCSEYMEKIISVMLHWCDKEAPLFPTLCTLLWLLAHKEEYKKKMLTTPNINHWLQKISVLVSRKQKMFERTRIKGQTLFHSVRVPIKPSLNPDWGLEYMKNPRIFNNSVDAFNSLVDILRN